MKTFKVLYKEIIVHEFFIDAESAAEIDEKFVEMANDGELDFSHGEIESSDIIEIEEV